jgi:hypothetical protein
MAGDGGSLLDKSPLDGGVYSGLLDASGFLCHSGIIHSLGGECPIGSEHGQGTTIIEYKRL